eukprot:CAMPEP_0119310324 /NCGR_PEP_ID=MMETSP1333-20130426/18804_1 /TAXON_ID=418940 /ORGANISM="Scyphosphaera apsteinii, Strain RCC1455" /LENGTH=228 /DNA_ID=CAMNT_0007314487 /DNA_START=237 /DNA_END=923 /DNA_ORIENTATION=+
MPADVPTASISSYATNSIPIRHFIVYLLLLLLASLLMTRRPAAVHEEPMPKVPAQPALGVAWVATPMEAAVALFEKISVGPADVFYELGCGDATVAIAAAKWGAQVICVELDPEMISSAQLAIKAAGVHERVQVVQSDLFDVDLRQATAVFMYILPAMISRLRGALDQLRPGARVISRDFEVFGWPCGHRVRLHGVLFLVWVAPVLSAEREEVADEVDHMQNCMLLES